MLKDNIHTNDNMYTTAGSYALWEAETHFEATVATRLREAGVILLGKTNMSEVSMNLWFEALTSKLQVAP